MLVTSVLPCPASLLRRSLLLAITALLTLLAIVVGACSASNVATPDYVGQPTSALIEVPYPPPPARVETVPKQPSDAAVWIDGEWLWQGRRWAWKPGRWVVPPSRARWSPWTSVRDRTGTLYLATGTWRDSSGNEVLEPEPAMIAKPAPAVIVNVEGEEVPRGPNVRLDAGTHGQGRDDLDAATTRAMLALDAALLPLTIIDGSSSSSSSASDGSPF